MARKKTLIFKINPKRPDKETLRLSADVLKKGGLVAFPTETVYGLGANLLDKDAMKLLRAVKKRPRGKPFTVHIADVALIKKLGCRVTKKAKLLIDKFWPGPLTIILKSPTSNKTIGFRMPKNSVALALIKEAALPVAAPSANVSGKAPPKNVKDVLKHLDGKIDLVIDAGRTDIGIESTVVDLSSKNIRVLREGAISAGELQETLGLRSPS